MKLGFVGTGAMTSAIVRGLSSSNLEPPSIFVSPRNAALAADLAKRFTHVSVASSNQDVLNRSETVLLAVRPQIARSLLMELRFRPAHHVISIMAGLSLRELSGLVAPAVRVTRAVPLPSAANKCSPTAIYPRESIAIALFGAVGTTFEVDTEDQLNTLSAATATIASYFAFTRSIAAWLERGGIAQAKAQDYVARMFAGVAKPTSEGTGASPEVLVAEYATPGGINEQLLNYLNERRVFEAVAQGLDAVLRRVAGAKSA